MENAFHVTQTLGNCIILLDCYFLSTNALERLNELHQEHPERILHIVTRAKRNCVAWQHVEMNGCKSIFVTTDTKMEDTKILKLYGYRFSIESLFRVLKQNMGGFSYHFWSKSMPKLNRYKRKDAPDVLENVTDEAERKKIAQTVRATEMFVLIAYIATFQALQSLSYF